MRVFVLFRGNRHLLDVEHGQTVSDIKSILRKKFDLDTVQNEDGDNDMLMALKYAGSNLDDDWVFTDISIPPGATLRCELQENVKTYLDVFCSYSGETIRFTEEFEVWDTNVSKLKTMITDKTGLHVSVFRLVTSEGKEMYDCHPLKKYSIDIGDTVRLETWNGWSVFLKAATKGQLTPTIKHMVSIHDDPLVAKYQLRVALFIAAHFDYPQLAAQLIKCGARCDEPVGEHPVREWCNRDVHPDHYKTPIHEASQHGSLQCLQKFLHHNYACILAKDARGLTPCNIARRYGQTECFKLLIAEQFRSRSTSGLTLGIYWRVRRWCERARDRAVIFHKHSPNPLLLAMENRNYRNAVVGQRVQVDGFGENIQTGASKLQLSLALKGVKNRPSAGATVNKAVKSIQSEKEDANHLGSFEFQSSSGTSEGNDTLLAINEVGDSNKNSENLTCVKCSLPAVTKARIHGESFQPESCNKYNLQISNSNSSEKKHGAKNQYKAYKWKQDFDRHGNDTFCSCRTIKGIVNKPSDETSLNQKNRKEAMPNVPRNQNLVCPNKREKNKQIQSCNSPHDKNTAESRVFFVTQAFADNPINSKQEEEEKVEKKKTDLAENTKCDKIPPLKPQSLVGRDFLSLGNARHDFPLKSAFSSKSDGELGKRRRRTQSMYSMNRGFSADHHRRATSDDLSLLPTQMYSRITGQDIREAAKQSMDVATTFKKKRWLQQVHMAIELNNNTFKRQLHDKYSAKPRASYTS